MLNSAEDVLNEWFDSVSQSTTGKVSLVVRLLPKKLLLAQL